MIKGKAQTLLTIYIAVRSFGQASPFHVHRKVKGILLNVEECSKGHHIINIPIGQTYMPINHAYINTNERMRVANAIKKLNQKARYSMYVHKLYLYKNISVYDTDLSVGGNSFMTNHTGQSAHFDDRKIATPSVFRVNEMISGLLKKVSFLYSRPPYTSETSVLELHSNFFR